MASTYENDLRLQEIGTGEQSGTWGTTTNTNLELVGEALSYSATGEAIANASTHTITVADGVADEARCFYLKCTGGGQACTVTLAPNSLSKVWVIENTTSYTLTFSQGSGANVAILAGQVKMIATDGAGSGAAVFDTMQDLAVPDLFVDDDVSLQSDGAIINFGVNAEIQLTHVHDTGLLLTETGGGAPTLQFRDSAISISSSADATLDIASDGAINLTAGTDVVIPANIGLTFGTGEKIEGDSTDLTITSGAKINLTATSDVVVPANVGITFGTGEKIEGDNTDLTITSGAKINLAATSDVHLANDIGMVFGDAGEKIEGNGTDLTINSSNDLHLTATTDINIPANVGLTFGDDGEKIEGDGTNLAINSSGDVNITATTVDLDGNLEVSGTITLGSGAVISEAELELLDGVTAGTAIASKVVTTDANIDTTGQRNLTITGELDAATLDISGAIDVAGTANLDVVDIDGAVDMASTLQLDGAVTLGVAGASNGFINSPSGIYVNIDSDGDQDDRFFDIRKDSTGSSGTLLFQVLESGAVSIPGTLGVTGVVTANAGVVVDNFTLDGTTLALSSGDFTLDVAGDIILDADGADIKFKHATEHWGSIYTTGDPSHMYVQSIVAGSSLILASVGGTSLTLDSNTDATFAADVNVGTDLDVAGNAVIDGTALVTGVLTTTAATVFNGGFAAPNKSSVLVPDGTGDNDWAFKVSNLEATDGRSYGLKINAGSTTDEAFLIQDHDASNTLFKVLGSGAVTMPSTALVTGVLTTTAATVFNGGFAANDGSTITTADNTDTLTLTSTDADANSGPNLRLYRNSGSPAVGDNLGQIDFEGRNDNSQDVVYASMRAKARDETDGTEDGGIQLDVMKDGSLTSLWKYYSDGTTGEFCINDDSIDMDFRVESNGSANALFVDGGANHVNIMTSTDLGAVLNVSGNAYIQHADNSDTLTLESTDADSNAGPNLLLYRNSANPADSDRLGTLTFRGRNDNNQDVEYIVFDTFINDVSDGTEDATMDIRIMTGGSESSRINFDRTTTVFNEAGAGGVDFRIESGNNANMLVVNAGDDRVGIATASPNALLHVGGTAEAQGDTTNPAIQVGSTTGYRLGMYTDAESGYIENKNGDNGIIFRVKTAGEAMRIDGGTGKVGIGTTSPDAIFTVDTNVGATSTGTIARFHSSKGESDSTYLQIAATRHSTASVQRVQLQAFDDDGSTGRTLALNPSGGSVGVGTNTPVDLFYIQGQASSTAMGIKIGTNGFNAIEFDNATGSLVGRITPGASSTAYHTSSDYRLKENVADMTGATARLKQLKPKRFNWIVDSTNTLIDGFLAHEVSSVVPEAIDGAKDAVHPAGHHEAGEIDPQGIDHSKLVPLLVKTIQELEARITVLEG